MNKMVYSLLIAGLLTSTASHANSSDPKADVSQGPISNSVKWTQQSKEYPLIVNALYRNAALNLRQKTLPKTPWLVIMDIDETLLNNSDYNRRLEQTNGSYTKASWKKWVHEQAATAIPGAKHFVKTVLELGGQVALVTNREHSDDKYTWQNLTSVGFPITHKNTCLVGRRAQDKSAIDNLNYINDKDLRRQEFMQGNATPCWKTDPMLKQQWHKQFTLVMQIGDNIEDIAATTQKNVSLDKLLKRQGDDILILPNSMYGSWDH